MTFEQVLPYFRKGHIIKRNEWGDPPVNLKDLSNDLFRDVLSIADVICNDWRYYDEDEDSWYSRSLSHSQLQPNFIPDSPHCPAMPICEVYREIKGDEHI